MYFGLAGTFALREKVPATRNLNTNRTSTMYYKVVIRKHKLHKLRKYNSINYIIVNVKLICVIKKKR